MDEHQNHMDSTERHSTAIGVDEESSTHRIRHQFRQVGLVRVQVEVLSLSQQHQMQRSSKDQYESEPEESDQDQEEPPQTDDANSAGQGDVDASSSRDHSGNNPTQSSGRNRKRGKEGREDDQDGNKRACRRPLGPQPKMKLPRLACPFQAYDRHQSCLRPGRCNPEGGCAGMSRVKSVNEWI